MEKTDVLHLPPPSSRHQSHRWRTCVLLLATIGILWLRKLDFHRYDEPSTADPWIKSSPYGSFPRPDDKFHFIPCSGNDQLPPLNDTDPLKTWAKQFDPNPEHWSWGKDISNASAISCHKHDHHAGRGIYLCGFLDVPLDYINNSDSRIVRLAVNKFQVSGLAYKGHHSHGHSSRGKKSARTIVINPGGPGGSGTASLWGRGEKISDRFSSGQFDVLGWDPRGVNLSLPRASCFPYDADRDRWSLLAGQYREASTTSPQAQLELADSFNHAIFQACRETLGDFGRFVSTAFVARDVDQILTALDEPELTGYFVSYGTGIGQTFANMFPNRVGRLILDGTEYVRDHRLVGGFGWTALDNATDAWNDGFLGECIAAGPEHCDLAKLKNDFGAPVSLPDLQVRMQRLVSSLATIPRPATLASSGPSLVTYSSTVAGIYQAMYGPSTWPTIAKALYELDQGNTTAIAELLEFYSWEFKPPGCAPRKSASTDELGMLVICADTYDAPKPFSDELDDLDWWAHLWQNMTTKNWISGNDRFFSVLPCRHYNEFFNSAAEVYRGDLNHTLSNPVLLIAETYDPATPLRNGRRLLAEMGENARLIVHHGYGHASSGDPSDCTDEKGREYILHGTVPEESETDCYANEKPYRYDGDKAGALASSGRASGLEVWREHMREMRVSFPGVVRH